MGPSGSGKSTLLQLLGGLDQPTAARSSSRADDQPAVRRRGHAPAPRPDRLRLPVVQPHPAARRDRERRAAVHHRRRGPDRGASSASAIRDVIDARRPDRQGASPARPAVGRRAAAGGRRPRARDPPRAAVRRRADRQPRLHDRHRDPRRRSGARASSAARRSCSSPTIRRRPPMPIGSSSIGDGRSGTRSTSAGASPTTPRR